MSKAKNSTKSKVASKGENNSLFCLTGKYRNICFTLNNYTDDSLKALKAWSQVSYLVVGKEVGESGTPHLQGYFELKTSVLGSTIKNKIPTAHLERRMGTPAQAAKYCKKDGNFQEIGSISPYEPGKRNDIHSSTDLIERGVPMLEVALANPDVYVKYHRGLTAFRSLVDTMTPRDTQPEVIVLYGGTGVGKTRYARELCAGHSPYVWMPTRGVWWDNYDGQKHVIIEEYRGQLDIGSFLSLIDRYEHVVQFKGGSCQFKGTYIVITSPVHPAFWHAAGSTMFESQTKQILRRITKLIDMDNDNENPYKQKEAVQTRPPAEDVNKDDVLDDNIIVDDIDIESLLIN